MRPETEATYDHEIDSFVKDHGDHEQIRRPRVVRWIDQFGDADASLAIKVLRNLRYFGASNLLAMSNQLVEMIRTTFPHTKSSAIFFVPVGGAGSGAHFIARHLKNNPDVPNSNIIDLLTLHRESRRRKVEVAVFMEDFSGTGQTLMEWWNLNAPIILPIGCTVVLGILVMNSAARGVLEGELTTVAVEELPPADNVLAECSERFEVQEKERLVSHCDRTACSPRFRLGFGDCGLLVAFQHGCPNNSLPILWHESEDWESLFRRRSA